MLVPPTATNILVKVCARIYIRVIGVQVAKNIRSGVDAFRGLADSRCFSVGTITVRWLFCNEEVSRIESTIYSAYSAYSALAMPGTRLS
jgi:hypothetical protein